MLKYLFMSAAVFAMAQFAVAGSEFESPDQSLAKVELVFPDKVCRLCVLKCAKGKDTIEAIKTCGQEECNEVCKTNK